VSTGNPPHDQKQRDGPAGDSSSNSQYTAQGYPNEKRQTPAYTPGSGAAAGEEYGYASRSVAASGHDETGRLVLIDQQDGRIVGELGEGFNVLEQGGVEAGSKGTPILILGLKYLIDTVSHSTCRNHLTLKGWKLSTDCPTGPSY